MFLEKFIKIGRPLIYRFLRNLENCMKISFDLKNNSVSIKTIEFCTIIQYIASIFYTFTIFKELSEI